VKLPATARFPQVAWLHATLDGRGMASVDASDLKEFDTSTVALLLEALRSARQHGLKFHVRGASPKLIRLAALHGVAELLGLTDVPELGRSRVARTEKEI
jgi:ABC-type transporter Mla MlaB component